MRFLAAVIVGLSLAVPLAQAEPHDVTVYARESDCPGGTDFCFVTVGSLADIKEGDTVTFTLVNEGDTFHELVVVPYKDRDRDHKATDESTSLGEIDEIGPGESASATFTVPASGLYYWCALPGHESLGMWTEAPVAGYEKDSPNPFPLALGGVLFAALLVVRRRE